VLWSEKDDLGDLYPDIPGIWRNWADDVTCGTIDSGHHMAEEAPGQLAGALRAFLAPERVRAGRAPASGAARLTWRPRSTPPRPW
jgi:haloacetate dehalogenase